MSDFDGVCATWWSRGDDGNGGQGVPDSALDDLTFADPRPRLLWQWKQMVNRDYQLAHGGGGGVLVMVGSVCAKMNGVWSVRCPAWTLQRALASRDQPYQTTWHAVFHYLQHSSNAVEYACCPPDSSAAR